MLKPAALLVVFAGLFMTSVASGQTVEIYADDGSWHDLSVIELPAVGDLRTVSMPSDLANPDAMTVNVGAVGTSVEEAAGPPTDLLQGLRIGLLSLAVSSGGGSAGGLLSSVK